MTYKEKVILDIELHSVEGIRECFINGVLPNDVYRDRPLIQQLIGEYTRSPRFKECVKLFVDFGLSFENQALLAVLLDDHEELTRRIDEDGSIVHQTCSFRSAYTPMDEVTLLHVCAEFNHLRCADVLVNNGADINAARALTSSGLGVKLRSIIL